MEKVPLFINKKEVLLTVFIGLCLFVFSIGYEYTKFLHVKKYPTFTTEAKIVSVYEKRSKKGKKYQVLKFQSKDFHFYTISWKALHVEKNSTVRIEFYTKNITFLSYFKGFFAPHKSLKIVKIATQDLLHVNVAKQHEELKMQELYLALFFAKPYSQELRYEISKWGISHLVAISGFHLGIISSLLFLLLRPLYRFFQDKYFPYRNSFADLAFIVFLLLGVYVYYIDLVPSVLRAYAMSIVGFYVFSKNIKLLSFETLLVTVAFVLILFPKLLFSIAFWFSVSGVFYIFLFLYHFAHLKKSLIFVLLNFWVYILMLPVIHYVFDIFTFYQFLSPFLSMFFILFYPLSFALHVMGFGGVFDEYVLSFLEFPMQVYSLHVSLKWLAGYLFLSLLAIRYRYLALSLPLVVLAIFFIEYIA